MKITRVRTIQAPEQPHILWLQVFTDEGIVGLGETYHNAHAIRAMLVQEFAPRYLLGKDPLAIEETWRAINEWTNFAGWAGADQRALSAIDIALWDILGQATGRIASSRSRGAGSRHWSSGPSRRTARSSCPGYPATGAGGRTRRGSS